MNNECRYIVDREDYAAKVDGIKPLDLLWIDIDPYDGHGGIVVLRILETQAQVEDYQDALRTHEIVLVGIVKRKDINKNTRWFYERKDEEK